MATMLAKNGYNMCVCKKIYLCVYTQIYMSEVDFFGG